LILIKDDNGLYKEREHLRNLVALQVNCARQLSLLDELCLSNPVVPQKDTN
jgi:hypothetical protein